MTKSKSSEAIKIMNEKKGKQKAKKIFFNVLKFIKCIYNANLYHN